MGNRKQCVLGLALFCLLVLGTPLPTRAGVRHYVFFGMDRRRITEPAFLGTEAFEGAQIRYSWRTLEPEEGKYDFRAIREDLALLRKHGKRLFIQLQDVSFDPKVVHVPPYLRTDRRFHGGADKQYQIPDDNESKAVHEGWVARRWDPAVQERLHALFRALGREFDGKIEGINLAETAVVFGESGKLWPVGFSPARYREAIIENLRTLKAAFPRSVAMVYANFMPGEWLPDNDAGHLKAVYREAIRAGVGVGGPDLLPYRKGQLNHAYPLIRAASGVAPTGVAVQEGNYASTDPKTGKRATIADLLSFAHDSLRVDYLFWCMEEPYFSRDLVPFLRRKDTRP